MAATTVAAGSVRVIRRTAWTLTGALAVAAWLALWTWEHLPWGRVLDHHGGASDIAVGVQLAVFLAAWALMLTAMMLPTTAPLLALFAQVVRERTDRRRLVSALLAGYGSVWMAAGMVAYGADLVLHEADHRWAVVGDRGWLLVAGALGAAGAYQLTTLKQKCLTACRGPYGLLLSRWRGRSPLAEAYAIGAEHGRTCVGCCWALMTIMFAIGTGGLGWMLALAGVMTVEKTARWGGALTRPLGVGLVTAAVAVTAVSA